RLVSHASTRTRTRSGPPPMDWWARRAGSRSSPRPRRSTWRPSSPDRSPTTTGHRSRRSYTSPGGNGATSSPTTPVSRCASSATTPTRGGRRQSSPPPSSSRKPHAAQSHDTTPQPTDSPPPNGRTRSTQERRFTDLDIADTILAKSDQVNAVDLAVPVTVTVEGVDVVGGDQ